MRRGSSYAVEKCVRTCCIWPKRSLFLHFALLFWNHTCQEKRHACYQLCRWFHVREKMLYLCSFSLKRKRFCLFVHKICKKSEFSFLMLLEAILKPLRINSSIWKLNFMYPVPAVFPEHWRTLQARSEWLHRSDCSNWHFVPTSQWRSDKGNWKVRWDYVWGLFAFSFLISWSLKLLALRCCLLQS